MNKPEFRKTWPDSTEQDDNFTHFNSYQMVGSTLFVEAGNGKKYFFPERRIKGGVDSVLFRNTPEGLKANDSSQIASTLFESLGKGREICKEGIKNRLLTLLSLPDDVEHSFSSDDFTKKLIFDFFGLSAVDLQNFHSRSSVHCLHGQNSSRSLVTVSLNKARNTLIIKKRSTKNAADFLNVASDLITFLNRK